MNMDEIADDLKKLLPFIGAAATGGVPALVAAAAAAVGNAIGKPVDATGAAITAAVASATPEQQLALKQAENQFALDMQKLQGEQANQSATLEIQGEAMVFADVADARARDEALMKTTGHPNKRANFMLGVVVFALAALVTMMAALHISADSALGGIVILLIGKFASSWETAFQFEFGTTRSSRTKDDAINAALTKK